MLARAHPAVAHIACPMPPWALSGTVVVALVNDQATFDALGAATQAPPYKAAPRAPVLGIKPPACLLAPSEPLRCGPEGLQIGAGIGLVLGRTACRLGEADALRALAGFTLVVDAFVPHASLYRPAARARSRDGSCLVGPTVVPLHRLGGAPEAIEITVQIGRAAPQPLMPRAWQRGAARLLAEVSEFMTLSAGDVLVLGIPQAAPVVHSGQTIEVSAAGIGTLRAAVVAEAVHA
jgi:5-oxopent-3-ene-1,2,5-tricarboxylate decarboxylase/2-hydroxyhepta-2,4-diene-1,7-dioate isomerase